MRETAVSRASAGPASAGNYASRVSKITWRTDEAGRDSFDTSIMQGISPDFLLAFTSSHQPPDVFDYAAIDREVPNMDQASKLSPCKFS